MECPERTLTPPMLSLLRHIRHVLGVGAEKQMIRIKAWWCVATMQDMQVAFNGTMRGFPCCTMSIDHGFRDRVKQSAVAALRSRLPPQPARRRISECLQDMPDAINRCLKCRRVTAFRRAVFSWLRASAVFEFATTPDADIREICAGRADECLEARPRAILLWSSLGNVKKWLAAADANLGNLSSSHPTPPCRVVRAGPMLDTSSRPAHSTRF